MLKVQFVIGTPPGSGRRRSTSSSLCETPPPPNVWQVSPVSAAKHTPTGSPLRRSGQLSVQSGYSGGTLTVTLPIYR